MEDTKAEWLSWFISIRNSRREDMRYYTSFSIGTCISVVAILAALVVVPATRPENMSLMIAAAIVTIIAIGLLAVVLRNFLNQYHLAEVEAKDYSDAIELIIMNPAVKSEKYQMLYYLLNVRKYPRKMEWGKFALHTRYLTAGLGDRQKQVRKILVTNRSTLNKLYECFCNPELVAESLGLNKGIARRN